MDLNKLFHASNQMDRETLRSFEDGCPTKVCRDILGDHLGRSTSLPGVPSESSGHENFSEPRPLESPPGVAQLDKIMDHFDALDRRDLAMRLSGLPPKDAA
jgi:hypothetical protein